jgi:PKD repeat protein
MKTFINFKIVSLFLFLFTAQSILGQSCADYSDWSDYPSNNVWYQADEVYYNGKIYSPQYYSTTELLSNSSNRDETGCGNVAWCFVTDCTGSPSDTLFYEDFEDEIYDTTSGTGLFGYDWGTDTTGTDVAIFGTRWVDEFDGSERWGDAFYASDTDGTPNWYTEKINISNYTDLSFSFMGYGHSELDSGDYIKISYKLDSGNLTQLAIIYDGFTTQVLDWGIDVTGVELEVFIEFSSNEDDEYWYVNDIKLRGSSCPNPIQYGITGDDLVLCSGDSTTLTAIGLGDSESGINYQLLKDSVNQGSAIAGTGSAISFGNFNSAGTYTVVTAGNCPSLAMSGDVVITDTNVAAVAAGFTTITTDLVTNENIAFTNTSSDATTSSWDFGDSSTASAATNPTHSYTIAGTFTATLTATNSCSTATTTTTITVSTAGSCSAVGTILMEKYDAIGGYSVSNLTNSANYPENPSSDAQLTSFETATDVGDNYGVKVSGYICASTSGYYTFWIAGDDHVQLNLSTDADPANKTTIASHDGYTASREWDKYPAQKSTATLLRAGNSYYVEAFMKEAGGGDNLAVGWAKPGESTTVPSEVIPGSVLSPADSNYTEIFTNSSGDNYWGTASNWLSGSVPTSSTTGTISSGYDVIVAIPDGVGSASLSAVIKNILIESGGSLSIENHSNLTVSEDFTNNGYVTLNSTSDAYSSLIVGGTATGDIVYNRWVYKVGSWDYGWDLVGSPVLALSLNDFYNTNTNNGTDGGPLDTQGDLIALGTYDNAWNDWELYTTSTIVGAGNFITGKGYQIGASVSTGNLTGKTIAYTGQIATQTQTTPIINNNGTNTIGRRWNVVANPFPSYIKGNSVADTNNNFLTVNEDILPSNYLALYGKRSDGVPGYIVYNHTTNIATGGLLIAPGQGFLVAANTLEVQQLQFTPAMRTVLGGDDFISGAPVLNNYLLNLKLFHGSSEEAETLFYFKQGLSPNLDPGYDAGAPSQEIALSSRLTEDDQGVNFSINAMDIDAINNEVIPLVINQPEGQPFRISISENTIPENVNIYLEDVLNGTMTSLKTEDFELTALSDLSDANGFFIHFTTQNLVVDDVLNINSLYVYKANTDTFITIKGLNRGLGKTTATLYNMLGMKVRAKTLNNTETTQRIDTSGLSKGVYVVKIEAGSQLFTKKIIVE